MIGPIAPLLPKMGNCCSGELMMAIRAWLHSPSRSPGFGHLCRWRSRLRRRPETKKRSKQEQQEIEQVVKLVDGVMAGQPAPADITMTLDPFFMKSQEQRTFVPFVLNVKNAPADRRGHVRARRQSGRHARPEGEEGRVPVGRHPLHSRRPAHRRQRQAQARVHGDRRHLRRLHRVQGAPPREGAEDPGGQDGRAQDADHGAGLPQRRARDQHASWSPTRSTC